MFTLTLQETRLFDEESFHIRTLPERDVKLEHSLHSLAEWESITKKPFIKTFSNVKTITEEDLLLYIKCMDTTGTLTNEDLLRITSSDVEKIFTYVNDPMTATTINSKKEESSTETITAEIIYWWMCHYHIPTEYEYWHLNRLLTLVKVCNIKEQGPNKETKAEAIARTRALKQARRAKARGPHV